MEDKVTAFARESFPKMSEDERREAIRSLRRLINEEMFSLAGGGRADDDPEQCPRCGHWHVAKRGKDPDGAQRYLCRNCSKTFCGSTLKVFSTTDGSNAYPKVLKALDVRRHDVSPSEEHGINVVNNLHSRLVCFLDGFRSVATRRLWNYLAWFKWIWTFKVGRTAGAVADMVVKHVSSNPYRTTWRECKNTPYPFYDYWEKQAGWDATARAALPLAALGA